MKHDYFYIGQAACGHIRCAIIDGESAQDKKEVADVVAEMVRDGLNVSRVENDDVVRSKWGSCHVCDPKRHPAPIPLFGTTK